jgi:hypothetical protein
MEDTDALHEDEDQIDGCLCGVEFNSDALADADLPPAAGGVQAAVEEHRDEDEVDGCDVRSNGNDVTTDRELPVAAGGVL